MNANQILQRGGGIARDTLRLAERLGRRVASDTYGMVQDARHLGRSPKPGMDDVTLTRKVESEIFRAPGTPKSTVNVNVVDGVVWLRGEVKRPHQIRSLEEKARAIPEVRGVENLLHLTKTPAPTRADTPRRQQRTRSSTRRPSPNRRTTGRVSDDRTSAITSDGEASPAEHARRGEGRSPAPLGASGTAEEAVSPATTGQTEQAASPATPGPTEEAASPATPGTAEEATATTGSAGETDTVGAGGSADEALPPGNGSSADEALPGNGSLRE